MFDETDREFHERRARAELDLAYRSASRQAMAAHLRLSALHMAELRASRTAPGIISAGRLPAECLPA